ncbi:hypothetical protein C9374_014016 [Naegleria lovaniensis]|uniref:Transmembrane protein n=1 Tax=Naegleria lovaniensis TaxID=51637 RepID=A0AA88KQ96_NAELO|nr:uncharacterized protein C9374_014016 [Naegleria lovaniensis]KAG2389456.1 hypothetical protein C9374_014016 [Naegleria lovaniensis]
MTSKSTTTSSWNHLNSKKPASRNGKLSSSRTSSSQSESSLHSTNNPSKRSALWFSALRYVAITFPIILIIYGIILYQIYSQIPPNHVDPYYDDYMMQVYRKLDSSNNGGGGGHIVIFEKVRIKNRRFFRDFFRDRNERH